MEARTFKSVELQAQQTDAKKDIDLINKYAISPMSPEDVFAFSVTLADNEVDRDLEQFSPDCLKELAKLFVGKVGILDHSWSAQDQIARIYRCDAIKTASKNSRGEPLHILKASAYIPRNKYTDEVISKIESGILKEVSVGVSVGSATCSICGAPMRGRECNEGHTKGLEYGGQLCYGLLKDPTDAYEFSFVAVPAQRGAGVTKGAKAQNPGAAPAHDEAARRMEILKIINDSHESEEKIKMAEKKRKEDTKTPWPVEAKALVYRRGVTPGGGMSNPQVKELLDGLPGTTDIDTVLLPQNMQHELIVEPMVQNPIRQICTTSNIYGLVEGRLAFTAAAGSYDNVAEGEIAKEIELTGDKITYLRNCSKIVATVSDSVVHGTSTNLVAEIEAGLKSGVAGNEISRLFDVAPDDTYAHMSFYSEANNIKTVPGTTKQDAIFNALEDLSRSFRANATIVMSPADWYAVTLSGVFNVPLPEAFARPIVLVEGCVDPVVGDFSFLRINYDGRAKFDGDKNPKAGVYDFVLTTWYDIQFRLKAAFRIATVEP